VAASKRVVNGKKMQRRENLEEEEEEEEWSGNMLDVRFMPLGA
jgi:hypothetical protein